MMISFSARRVLLATATCAMSTYVLILYLLLVGTGMEDESDGRLLYVRDKKPPLAEDMIPDWGKDHPLRYHKHALLSAQENPNPYENGKFNPNSDARGVGINVSHNKSADQLWDPSMCLGVERPLEDFEEPLLWQPVEVGQTYVFSSYLEVANSNNSGRVLIIGISTRPSTDLSALYCQVWYRNRHAVIVTRAQSSAVPGYQEKTFAVYFWRCPADVALDPYAVSLVENPCQGPPANILLLRNVDESQGVVQPPSKFTVCVPPIIHNYNNTARFVEMMELNYILGADRAILYDYSGSDFLRQYMQSYVLEDLVTVIPWSLPPLAKTSPSWGRWKHHFGQLAAINDCLYRSMFASLNLVFTDLDEVIIPRSLPDWRTMLDDLQKGYTNAAAFSFRNIVFPLSLPDDETIDEKADETRYDLVTQLKTRRQEVSSTERRRPNMIVRPSEIFMIGLHGVEGIGRGVTKEVAMETASVHQYRRAGDAGRVQHKTDRIMHLYKNALLRTVKRRHLLVRGRHDVSLRAQD